ncbi:MAG: RidA family protein [Dehalococcoidia bacterium]|nr:RidA family protein [Dehalococcoidia bacterium]
MELLNPEGLPKPEHYRQVAIAKGTRMVFLAGQVARTPEGNLVGAGDLAAQTEQAMVNVATAVQAAGGTFDDVAKLTFYIVDWKPEKMANFGEGLRRAAKRLGLDLRRPSTLLGVTALAEADYLVEIEATAVLP